MTYVSTNSSFFFYLPSTKLIIPDALDVIYAICELLVFCGWGKKTTNTSKTNKKWAKTTQEWMSLFMFMHTEGQIP